MISVCIPAYNFDITSLVKTLSSQAAELGVPYEILVIDDVSGESFRQKNRVIKDWHGVRYIESSSKLGRAKIRNRLAAESAYDNLIFMDCDSLAKDNQYLAGYLPYFSKNTVVSGGRIYDQDPPKDNRYFRWFYGVHRESIKAELRNKNPYCSFMTNNFLIPKKILLSMPFDESLQLYGHEDTLMGYKLKNAGIALQHIDNSLVHIGLENAADFISKTEKGLDNLLLITRNLNSDKSFISDVRVLKVYFRCRQIKIKSLLGMFFRVFRQTMYRNLNSKNPSLFIFDLYKLGYLCYTDR